MSNSKLPIIFILDMDKCIIGNSIFLRILNKKPISSPYFIRPFFKEFINIFKNYNIKFFIFSFGDKSYVENMIKYIEETIEFKFNRPLFTRENKIIKDIDDIKEYIIKSLKSNYSPLELETIFNYRLIIIDDNKIFWFPNHPQLLICNPYEYTLIPHKIRNSKIIIPYLLKNNEVIKDDFFKSLINLIKPRLKLQKPFTPKFITYLNKSF